MSIEIYGVPPSITREQYAEIMSLPTPPQNDMAAREWFKSEAKDNYVAALERMGFNVYALTYRGIEIVGDGIYATVITPTVGWSPNGTDRMVPSIPCGDDAVATNRVFIPVLSEEN